MHTAYCVVEKKRQSLLCYQVNFLQGMRLDHYQETHSQQVNIDNGRKDQCANLYALVGIVLFLKLLEQTDFLRGHFLVQVIDRSI